MPPAAMALSGRDILLALTVIVIWGFNFVVIKVGVGEIPPLLLTGLRFAFAALPAVFFLPRPRTSIGILVAFGLVLGVIKFGLLFVGMKLGMAAGLSSLVLQGQAAFTMVLAWLLLGEKPGGWQIAGALVAFAGIALLALSRDLSGGLLPFLMVVAAAAAWGCANIITKKAGRIDMLAFIVWASLVPPLPLLALSLWLEGGDAIITAIRGLSWAGAGAVLYLAYPVTLFGFAIWNGLLSRNPASAIAPFSLLVPVVGLVSGAVVLGEELSLSVVIGAAVVIGGLCMGVFGPRLSRRWA